MTTGTLEHTNAQNATKAIYDTVKGWPSVISDQIVDITCFLIDYARENTFETQLIGVSLVAIGVVVIGITWGLKKAKENKGKRPTKKPKKTTISFIKTVKTSRALKL